MKKSIPSTSSGDKLCNCCQNKALYLCSQCKWSKYCSIKCQKKDWRDQKHSKHCTNIHNIDSRGLSASEITPFLAEQAVTILRINTEIISIERLLAGIKVEIEHDGREGVITDVTGGSILKAAAIAAAHFSENPGDLDANHGDYYHFLEKMEDVNNNYWYKQIHYRPIKPSIYLHTMNKKNKNGRLLNNINLKY